MKEERVKRKKGEVKKELREKWEKECNKVKRTIKSFKWLKGDEALQAKTNFKGATHKKGGIFRMSNNNITVIDLIHPETTQKFKIEFIEWHDVPTNSFTGWEQGFL